MKNIFLVYGRHIQEALQKDEGFNSSWTLLKSRVQDLGESYIVQDQGDFAVIWNVKGFLQGRWGKDKDHTGYYRDAGIGKFGIKQQMNVYGREEGPKYFRNQLN